MTDQGIALPLGGAFIPEAAEDTKAEPLSGAAHQPAHGVDAHAQQPAAIAAVDHNAAQHGVNAAAIAQNPVAGASSQNGSSASATAPAVVADPQHVHPELHEPHRQSQIEALHSLREFARLCCQKISLFDVLLTANCIFCLRRE